jgi:hypothetical protein
VDDLSNANMTVTIPLFFKKKVELKRGITASKIIYFGKN